MIYINSHTQTLDFKEHTYTISTSKFGLGETLGSYQTPRGVFTIYKKIGKDMPLYTIFKHRVPMGIWNQKPQNTDLILTRILWLAGSEKHNANTKKRYIYIHGTNEEQLLGTPASIGCIRMKNTDILELFNLVKCEDTVTIN